ncbi:hypothetical protein UE98_19025 [Burkholderia cenocepacia]|nr:hypothetical protein UE98_19025 [Burkholderia cenocepacia]
MLYILFRLQRFFNTLFTRSVITCLKPFLDSLFRLSLLIKTLPDLLFRSLFLFHNFFSIAI